MRHGYVHGRSAGVGAGFSVVLVDDVYECFTDYSQHGFNSTYVSHVVGCVFCGYLEVVLLFLLRGLCWLAGRVQELTFLF